MNTEPNPSPPTEPLAEAVASPDTARFSDLLPDQPMHALSELMTPVDRRRPIYSGWLIGIICGVVMGLWALPPVRYTLGAQLSFALAEDNVPWMRTLDARRGLQEAPDLNAVAATAANDYLVRVGRATALVGTTRWRGTSAKVVPPDDDDRALLRLTLVTRDFPDYPGACAHLARYMMMDRVRIMRAELAPAGHPGTDAAKQGGIAQEVMPARTIPATHRDVRLIEWAMRRGELLEPDNAFWPAMLATTYFAAERDQDGLRELRRINHTSHWDAYLYEEILGQWRLYSLAYGDHGAIQKIGPLSFLAFPHLYEIRRMAQLARWFAEKEARQGHIHQAIQIRHSIARLGRTMRDTASWAYEALYGTELTLIAYTDGDADHAESVIQTTAAWRPQARRLLELLTRARLGSEITWVTQEVEASCALRKAVKQARSDASYPGIPPGIPLAPLFGNWMAGVSLIQQCIALLASTLIATLLLRWGPVPSACIRWLFLPLCAVAAICSGGLLFLGVPTEPMAILLLISAALTTLLIFESLYVRREERGKGIEGRVNGVSQTAGPWGKREENTRHSTNMLAAECWQPGVTVRMLTLLLLPGLIALALLRPMLSGMHPVAMLLTRWFGSVPTPNAGEMLLVALLAGALPLAIILASGIWGLLRGVSPLVAALVGLRRMALPAVTCLVIVYLVLLQRTLLLDTQSSRAINEAARNDRQWVLTHIEPDTDSADSR